jgi:hypothetical protein
LSIPAAEKREITIPSFKSQCQGIHIRNAIHNSIKLKNNNLQPPPYSEFTHTNFSCVRKRQSSYSLRGEYQNPSISDPVDPLSSILFFKDFDPSVAATHQAKMKLSADFLATSTPASSVCFPFGRQAKLKQVFLMCRA